MDTISEKSYICTLDLDDSDSEVSSLKSPAVVEETGSSRLPYRALLQDLLNRLAQPPCLVKAVGSYHARRRSQEIDRQLSKFALDQQREVRVVVIGGRPDVCHMFQNSVLALYQQSDAVDALTVDDLKSAIRSCLTREFTEYLETYSDIVPPEEDHDMKTTTFVRETLDALRHGTPLERLSDQVDEFYGSDSFFKYYRIGGSGQFKLALANLKRLTDSEAYVLAPVDIAFIVQERRKVTNYFPWTPITASMGDVSMTFISSRFLTRCGSKRLLHMVGNAPITISIFDLRNYEAFIEDDDPLRSCLEENIAVWDSVWNSTMLNKSTHILILCGYDGLKSRLSRISLQAFYPDYHGGTDPDVASKFILNKFLRVVGDRSLRYYIGDLYDLELKQLLHDVGRDILQTRKDTAN